MAGGGCSIGAFWAIFRSDIGLMMARPDDLSERPGKATKLRRECIDIEKTAII